MAEAGGFAEAHTSDTLPQRAATFVVNLKTAARRYWLPSQGMADELILLELL